MMAKPLMYNGLTSSRMVEEDGTTAPARTGDPQIHNLVL
jgi:hypothetical protein